ncbi:MAG: LURP-one-related/scramblase family protein [Haloarculaceae archaeon]
MAPTDVIPGVDLTGDEYTVKQSLIRNKYAVYEDGDLLLRAKQKLFKLKEQFPFTDPDGEEVFEITAGGILDVAGDYTITTADDEAVAVLDKNWTLLTHKWKVRDPDDERLLARIESRGALFQLLRRVPIVRIVTSFIPHKYTIEDTDGNQIGEIAGRFSIRDIYDITIEDSGDAPKEALVAAAIAIDALEGN